MVATRAFLRRNHHNHNGAMDAESSNNQQSEVVDLTISEDEADVVELAQPNAKRQRRNAAAPGGKNPNQTRRGRALKPVNANDNRRTSTRTKATNATTTTTRATRSSSNAGLKPVAVAATARVVSENPSTKRAKVTRTTTTTTTTNNPRKRKAPSRPTAAYAFRKKAHVPIKTPATTEPTTSSGNDATSTHKPQRRGRGNNNSALSSKAAVTSKKRRSRSSTAKGGRSSTKQYQYDANADDIDARDQDDPLSVTAYVEDIYDYYREREPVTTVLKPLTTDCQPHVTEKMRMILVDWILEVHYKFKMNQESLYLAINILDRFLYMSTEEVSRRQLQLVGVTSLLLAAKYEEMFVPELRDLAYICDGAYTESQILDMEERILKDIEYNLTVPTAYYFLVRFLKAAHSNQEMIHIANMILDSTLLSFAGLTCKYLPSQLAAGAVMAARRTLGRYDWSPTLLQYSQYCEEDVIPVAKAILRAKDGIKTDLIALQKKYSKTKYGKVSEVELASMDKELSDKEESDDEDHQE